MRKGDRKRIMALKSSGTPVPCDERLFKTNSTQELFPRVSESLRKNFNMNPGAVGKAPETTAYQEGNSLMDSGEKSKKLLQGRVVNKGNSLQPWDVRNKNYELSTGNKYFRNLSNFGHFANAVFSCGVYNRPPEPSLEL